jgi:ankyrin repeat protein
LLIRHSFEFIVYIFQNLANPSNKQQTFTMDSVRLVNVLQGTLDSLIDDEDLMFAYGSICEDDMEPLPFHMDELEPRRFAEPGEIVTDKLQNPKYQHEMDSPQGFSILSLIKTGSYQPSILTPAAASPPKQVAKSRDNLLHRLCASQHVDEQRLLAAVRALVRKDPAVLSRPYKIKNYQYPLHIALNNPTTPPAVMKVLLEHADPTLFTVKDGYNQETPLHLFLKRHAKQIDVLDALLLKAPTTAAMMDRRGNTPLHVACMYDAAATAAIRHLIILEPQACYRINGAGQTPLQIAETKTSFDNNDAVLYLLRARTRYGKKSERAPIKTPLAVMMITSACAQPSPLLQPPILHSVSPFLMNPAVSPFFLPIQQPQPLGLSFKRQRFV